MKYNMLREHISYLTRITKLRSEEYVVQKILSTTGTTAKTHTRSDFARANGWHGCGTNGIQSLSSLAV